jgi:2-amino-4-hydroxy-6-hydroxymethyldihydropteridine diphosphokinase
VKRAFVGLGANLGDREATLSAAIALLEALDGVHVTAVSEFRETEPVGYLDQPRFLNAAAELETTLAPGELLSSLLDVERALGRTRDGPRFGPRTIDLDLLLVDGIVVEEPGLTVPHPRLHERRFALEPLADLDPELIVPGHGTVAQLLHQLE